MYCLFFILYLNLKYCRLWYTRALGEYRNRVHTCFRGIQK